MADASFNGVLQTGESMRGQGICGTQKMPGGPLRDIRPGVHIEAVSICVARPHAGRGLIEPACVSIHHQEVCTLSMAFINPPELSAIDVASYATVVVTKGVAFNVRIARETEYANNTRLPGVAVALWVAVGEDDGGGYIFDLCDGCTSIHHRIIVPATVDGMGNHTMVAVQACGTIASQAVLSGIIVTFVEQVAESYRIKRGARFLSRRYTVKLCDKLAVHPSVIAYEVLSGLIWTAEVAKGAQVRVDKVNPGEMGAISPGIRIGVAANPHQVVVFRGVSPLPFKL